MKTRNQLFEKLQSFLTVGDLVRPDMRLAFLPDTPAHNVVTALCDREKGAAGVVDNDGRLLGLITEHHIMARLVNAGREPMKRMPYLFRKFYELKASDLMLRHPPVLTGSTGFSQACSTMLEKGAHYMAIVDDAQHNNFMGIISDTEIFTPLQTRSDYEIEKKDELLSYLMQHEAYGGRIASVS